MSELRLIAVALAFAVLVIVIGTIEYGDLWPALSVVAFGLLAGRYGYLKGQK